MRTLALTVAVLGCVSTAPAAEPRDAGPAMEARAAAAPRPAVPAGAPAASQASAAASPDSGDAAGAADLDLLEFLGGDDEVDPDLSVYLARPAARATARPAVEPPASHDGGARR